MDEISLKHFSNMVNVEQYEKIWGSEVELMEIGDF